jgi:hypothetical protein
MRDMRSHRGWFPLFLFGRFLAARRLVAAMVARRAGMAVPASDACHGDLAGPPVATAVAALRQDGILSGLQLSQAVVAEVQAFARSRPCYGGLDWRTPFWPAEQTEAERRTGPDPGCGPDPLERTPQIG